MATIKHISSKNADYGAAEAYLTFEHDEFTMKPTLDEAGRLIPRQDYRLDTLNCGEEDFALSCIRANLVHLCRYCHNSTTIFRLFFPVYIDSKIGVKGSEPI